MKYVFVLEDDPKFQKEVVEALYKLNPNLQIRLFTQLEQFAAWVKEFMIHGKSVVNSAGIVPPFFEFPSIPDDGKQELLLVVSKIEFMGAGQLGLLKKVKQLFLQKSLNPEGSETTFVLTAFEGPNFNRKELEAAVVTNVIFKPFDRLILKEHLAYAMETHVAPSKDHEIAQQKTDTRVELLKDITIEGLSDIGFLSKTDRNIEIGTYAKYYGNSWAVGPNSAVGAICTGMIPHPIEAGFSLATFNFYDISQEQISALRKKIRLSKDPALAWKWVHADSTKDQEVNLIMIDEEEIAPGGLAEHFKQSYNGVNIISYNHFGTFMLDFDPAKAMKSESSAKALPAAAPEVELSFEVATKNFLGFKAEKPELLRMFSLGNEDLKKQGTWFYLGLNEKQKDIYTKMVTGGINVPGWDQVFVLKFKGEPYYLKVIAATKDAGAIHLKVKELAKDELVTWLQKNSKIPKKVHGIFVSDKYLGQPGNERWIPILDAMKASGGFKPRLIVLSKKKFTDEERRETAAFTNDCLTKPVDKSYLNQKIAVIFSGLKKKGEVIEIPAINSNELIKVVNPVRMTEVSEAGVQIEYDRDPGLDTYREFVLWQPYKVGDPELRAKANFITEPKEKGGPFIIQFIFFGVTEQFLKKIRVWIRDLYISTKKEAS